MPLISRIFVVLLATGLATLSLNAKEPSAFHAMLKKELNLSKEQEEKLEKLYSPDKSHMRTCYNDMEKAESSFEEVLHSSESSEKEIREKFEALQKSQETYAKARIDKIIAIRSILTPEQQTKFLKILEKKKKNKGQSK